MRHINSIADLHELVGQEVAVSDWLTISQERVTKFADATEDRQWIHIDVEKSKKYSPYGGTIAHGFLTLSLLPTLMEHSITIGGVGMGINYGVNKVRFPAAVRTGSRLRARMTLLSLETTLDFATVVWRVTMECDSSEKPVCIAETIVRLYA